MVDQYSLSHLLLFEPPTYLLPLKLRPFFLTLQELVGENVTEVLPALLFLAETLMRTLLFELYDGLLVSHPRFPF